MKRTLTLFGLIFLIALFFTNCSKPTNACFTYSPVTITANADVIFNASCSEMTSSYSWTFGDGKDTTTNELTVSHKYMSPGTYNVTLNAIRKDKNGFVRKGNPIATQTIIVQ